VTRDRARQPPARGISPPRAQRPCAYRWIAIWCDEAITATSSIPMPKAMPGETGRPHGRMRQTSCPTIALGRAGIARRRMPAATGPVVDHLQQCGSITRLEVGESGRATSRTNARPASATSKRRFPRRATRKAWQGMDAGSSGRLRLRGIGPDDPPAMKVGQNERDGSDARRGARFQQVGQ